MNPSALLGWASSLKKFLLTRSKMRGQGMETFEELLKPCEDLYINWQTKTKIPQTLQGVYWKMRKSAPLPGLLPVLRPCTIKHLKHGFNCLVQQFLSPRTHDTWAFFVPLLSRPRTSFLLTSYIPPTTLQRCPWSSRYRNRQFGAPSVRSVCLKKQEYWREQICEGS